MFHQNKQKIAKASVLCEARQELISRHVRAVYTLVSTIPTKLQSYVHPGMNRLSDLEKLNLENEVFARQRMICI